MNGLEWALRRDASALAARVERIETILHTVGTILNRHRPDDWEDNKEWRVLDDELYKLELHE